MQPALLQALAANSPFRHGRDTGLASAREVTLRGWARSGVPRAMASFEDFCEMTRVLARAADVPDYTWFWWKLRPHPKLGTAANFLYMKTGKELTADEAKALDQYYVLLVDHGKLSLGLRYPPALWANKPCSGRSHPMRSRPSTADPHTPADPVVLSLRPAAGAR